MIQLTFFRHNRCSEQEPLLPSRLSFYGFTVVLEGELEYQIDGEAFRLSAGDAVLIKPGMTRSRGRVKGADYFSFHFESKDPVSLPVFLPGIASLAVRQLLSVAQEISRSALSFEDERFHTLLSLVLQQISFQYAERLEHPVVRRIKDYLSAHLAEPVKLSDVGKAVLFSPNYCQSLFKKETGQSIIGYFLDLRIKNAEALIAAQEGSLSEIARKCGFEDYNYFSRQFKKRCGYTPTQYRRFLM